MVPFERVAVQVRSLYQAAHEFEPGALGGAEAPDHSHPAGPTGVVARYDGLLADAAAMLGAPCPPLPFTRADRLWLEEALVDLGLDMRTPSTSD